MPYFAYGSNMDWERMRDRCPTAKFLCCARLPHYRLAFTRRSVANRSSAADVLAEPGAEVWGVLYEITENDRQALDRHENVATRGYRPVTVRVEPRGEGLDLLEVMTYVVVVPIHNLPGPTAEYLARMVRGAIHWGLPAPYVDRLLQIKTA